MSDAKKGDLVQIHKIILKPDQRSNNLPASSRSVNYECWIKGFLLDENAKIGETARIETFIGREISGELYQVNPVYEHNFGAPQKEILSIGNEVKHQLEKKR
jgi:2-amino-4-ketopentanoate thiolase alpha subunit